jgi:hypothetical protein
MRARDWSNIKSEVSALLELESLLVPGDRVRMSALGRARHPKYGDRQGLVVSRGPSASSFRIKFDERASIQAIHQGYLEKVDDSEFGSSK